MQFLNAFAIMAVALSPSVMTATPYNPKCVADSTILSSVPGKLALAIVSSDAEGKTNSTEVWPVALTGYSLPTGRAFPAPYNRGAVFASLAPP